ncbi:MAG TPA: succinate dehydrogenase, hydrophobic membrane anchor protein [Stellaceae bacterium]|nr:succinate dehydrogenase, hydrophobic membrane anchor protein [Stellaceae bacterium]
MAMTRQMRSPLGRVLGLGSAKEGVQHWWMQRLTAVALVPLIIWFVIAALGMIGADRAAMVAWMHTPMSPVFAILLIVAVVYHLALGLQVVIEDYIHSEAWKLGLIIVMRLWCIVLVGRGVLAVLTLAFAG